MIVLIRKELTDMRTDSRMTYDERQSNLPRFARMVAGNLRCRKDRLSFSAHKETNHQHEPCRAFVMDSLQTKPRKTTFDVSLFSTFCVFDSAGHRGPRVSRPERCERLDLFL